MSSSSSLIKGTFILTLGTYISKLLGLFYVIPFFGLIGSYGAALYNYSYIPYSIFISISTAGVPLAISKFISKYNALGEYRVGRKLFKSGIFVMMVTGFLAFLTLYFMAPIFAESIVVDDEQITNLQEVVSVIRAVSFALLIVPMMSLVRGFFQGYKSMGPSAVSQVVEQIVRIAFLLIGTYIVVHVIGGTIVQAVQVATFAAFIGALGGMAVLVWYWIKRRPYLNAMLKEDRGEIDLDYKEMYKEIIISAIPFIVVGIANPLFQMVDELTFNQAMANIGKAAVSDTMFSILNFNSHKIVMIPVSLATAFSITLVPMITESFARGDVGQMHRQLNQTFQVLLFLTLPACLGISILAEPIYTFFYGANELGANILQFYAPVAILFALFSVTAAIIQGLNEQKFTVFSLLLGLLIKMLINIPLIERFETKGAILATAIGYSIAIIINLFVIYHYARYPFHLVIRRSIFIAILSLIMGGAVGVLYKVLALFLSPEARIPSVVLVLICAVGGAFLYFVLAWRSRLVQFLFPAQVKKLKEKWASH